MASYYAPLPADELAIQQCNDGSVTVTLGGNRTCEFGRPRDAYSFLRELYPPRPCSNDELEMFIDPRKAPERKP